MAEHTQSHPPDRGQAGSGSGESVVVDSAVLDEPGRVRAIAESGLGARTDEWMDALTQRVRRLLGVPVSWVSIVLPGEQVFPGISGSAEPWASRRRSPLTHSLCQHVVNAAEPLVIADAGVDPRARGNLAVSELGVAAYAGFPLTDRHGHVLGSLCAIDYRPREWTEAELDLLEGLAQGCAAELRMRMATHDFAAERERSDAAEARLRAALDRSQLLLTASEALTDAIDVDTIRANVTDLVSGEFKPAYVGLTLAGAEGRLHRVDDPLQAVGPEAGAPNFSMDAALPAALTARKGTVQLFEGPAAIADAFPTDTQQMYADLGVRAVACAPLLGVDGVTGVLLFGWQQPHAVDVIERAVITTLARYVSHALERVGYLQERVGVALQLQEAMLTTLPAVDGLRLAARYLPASTSDLVGGDWYDAIPLLGNSQPDARTNDVLAVMVGDITGHDMGAAAVMGQVRSMIRQATWDRPDGPPSAVVTAAEQACAGTGTAATGTLVHAHLRPTPRGWLMRWTCVGHPPPIVLHGDGTTTVHEGSDLLFGYPELRRRPPTDHELTLGRRDCVLLYTDGLIERRDSDLDAGIARVRERLSALVGRDPEVILDTLLEDLLDGAMDDDVVALIVQVS